MKKFKNRIFGVLFVFLLAIPSWFLGKAFPLIGSPVFGILLGMFVAFWERPIALNEGIQYTSKKLLQYSIVLLGFEMNLFNVIRVGTQSLFIMLFTLSTAFIIAYLVGKALRLQGKMTILIGVGTSICGGSAIAATAPVIQAEDEDVAHAISTIFLFNIVAVFIFPALGHLLKMSDIGFGMWAGTAINDTSSVVAAGAAWSASAGNNTALALATIVKLTRTLMIVPITLVLALYMTKKNQNEACSSTLHSDSSDSSAFSESSFKNQNAKSSFSIAKVFPWFVLYFVVAAIINTFSGIPLSVSHNLVSLGKFIIVMAMVAIGLNTHLSKLIKNGFKPIFLGLCCWFSVAIVSLLVQFFLKTW